MGIKRRVQGGGINGIGKRRKAAGPERVCRSLVSCFYSYRDGNRGLGVVLEVGRGGGRGLYALGRLLSFGGGVF